MPDLVLHHLSRAVADLARMKNKLFDSNYFLFLPWFICAFYLTSKSSITNGKSINSFAGPYYTYTTKVYNCDVRRPEKIAWRWFARITHYKPTRPLEPQLLTGNMSGTAVFNDSAWARFVLDLRSNNQWKENAFVFNFPNGACTKAAQNSRHTTHLLGNLYREKPCAVLPGTITKTDYPLKVDYPNVPILPYGVYRFRFMANYIGISDPATCLAADFVISPRT